MTNPLSGDVVQPWCHLPLAEVGLIPCSWGSFAWDAFSPGFWSRTDPSPLHSITSSPAKHLSLLRGELGTAPRGQGTYAASGSDSTRCGPASGSEQGAWQGFPAELLEGEVLCRISLPSCLCFLLPLHCGGEAGRSFRCLRAQRRPQIIPGLKLTGWAAGFPHPSALPCGSAATREDHTYP